MNNSLSLFFPPNGRCLPSLTERAIELRMLQERAWIVEELIHLQVRENFPAAGSEQDRVIEVPFSGGASLADRAAHPPADLAQNFGGTVVGLKSDASSASILERLAPHKPDVCSGLNDTGSRTAKAFDPHNPYPKGRYSL